jgi:hypothetical protein
MNVFTVAWMLVCGVSVTHTARNGKVSRLELVYLRGSQLRFIVLPEILKNATVFKKVRPIKPRSYPT